MTPADASKPTKPAPRRSRIQQQNRARILDAALQIFAAQGFGGTTLDQIAQQAGLSKPNLLYYFGGKEEIHTTLLTGLLQTWLDPLRQLDGAGDPLEEICAYVRRKMEMSREYPRESRLFANEILMGAPRMGPHLQSGLKPLFDEKCALIAGWMDQGHLSPTDPGQLLLSIWAVTQHYADFDAQVQVLMPDAQAAWARALDHTDRMFRKLLAV